MLLFGAKKQEKSGWLIQLSATDLLDLHLESVSPAKTSPVCVCVCVCLSVYSPRALLDESRTAPCLGLFLWEKADSRYRRLDR